MAIERILVLSTGHMPCSKPDFGNLRHAEHMFGYIVFLLSSADGQVELAPAWLQPVIELAHNEGATHINFDRDEDNEPALRTWEW